MELSEDIVNIIISYLFDECENCFKYFHNNELIQYCWIYMEQNSIVIYDIICIHCLNKFYCKHKIMHL